MTSVSTPARIVHMTSVHLWHDTRVYARMCRSLAQRGFDVHLVAAVEGDGNQAVQIHDGVNLHPVPRLAGRAARLWKTGRAVCRTAKQLRGDIYHFHDPELIPHALAMAASGCRVIYDVHEDVPKDLVDKHWLPPIAGRVLGVPVDALERLAASRFAAIIAADEPIRKRFERFARHTLAINNYPYLADFDDYDPSTRPDQPPTLVCFGGVSRLRAIEPLVDAMGMLAPELSAQLIVSGRCESDELMTSLRQSPGFQFVDYKGWLTHTEMRGLLRGASLAINLLSHAPNNYSVRSNRFFESLAYGIPVLSSNFPCWVEIVDEIGCGVTADPTRAEQIAQQITQILTDPVAAQAMGKRGRQAIEQQFNWEHELTQLVELYETVLSE